MSWFVKVVVWFCVGGVSGVRLCEDVGVLVKEDDWMDGEGGRVAIATCVGAEGREQR